MLRFTHPIKAQLSETARSMRNLIFMTTVDEMRGEPATIGKAGKAIGANLAQFDALDSSAQGRELLKAAVAVLLLAPDTPAPGARAAPPAPALPVPRLQGL